MINFPLFKQSIKLNYKIVIIFMVIVTMYSTMTTSMYDPESLSLLEEFTETMPEIMALFGMTGNAGALIGFLITYLYGFIFIMFPLILFIITSHKLVASHVDKGSMSYLLASPNKRKTIILTQMSVLNFIILIFIIYITLLTIITCNILFPGELVISKLILLNIGLFIFHSLLGSISFLASAAFNETKYSLMFGAGIPLLFYLIQMLSNLGGKLDNLKYFTIFSLFQPFDIINKEKNILLFLLIALLITIVLNVLSVTIFKNKNMSV